MGGGSDLGVLSPVENCVLGITAGMACKLTNYPLLSWKNTVQQGLPLSMNPAIVYRGLVMAMLNLGGSTGVQVTAHRGEVNACMLIYSQTYTCHAWTHRQESG